MPPGTGFIVYLLGWILLCLIPEGSKAWTGKVVQGLGVVGILLGLAVMTTEKV